MKDDYIRRQDAITAACKGFCHPGVRCPNEPCREQTKYLRDLHSADVVQVVRCKDCKHLSNRVKGGGKCWRGSDFARIVGDNDFCSYGERRKE